MILRFSVRAGRNLGQGKGSDADPWRVVDVALVDGEVSIGRRPGSAIELPFPAVSARHARFFRAEDGYRIEDLGSVNGTRTGDRRLQPGVPLPIVAGEVLDVAGIGVRFDGELPSDEIALQGGTDTLARRLVHDVFAACPPGELVRMVGIDGPGSGRELPIPYFGRPLLIGRGESCDFVLCDEDVSREHASIARSGAGVTLRDLDSKNGIRVQGRRVDGACWLHDGDIVRIGRTSLRMMDPEDRYLRQIQSEESKAEAEANRRSTTVLLPSKRSQSENTSGDSPGQDERSASSKHLPTVATAVGIVVLLSLVGLVLALAFGC